MPNVVMDGLSEALEAQRERLMPCVHCGFCLAACPTYNRLGDEADSPRGRLHLMGAVVEGRLAPTSEAFRTHIDRCLGCRACEPVCPSGVEYGALLELARDVATRHAPPALPARVLLGVFRGGVIQSLFFFGGRLMRGSGLAFLGARGLPRVGLLGSAKLGLAMLASSGPWKRLRTVGQTRREPSGERGQAAASKPRGRVALLTGCVQGGLYARVNAATVRVIEANGYELVDVAAQGCCGALHAHSGALDDARGLARVNVAAFGAADVDWVVVNAAGCGATMKEYGHLIGENEAGEVPEKVRDVTEFLAAIELRVGAPVPCSVAVRRSPARWRWTTRATSSTPRASRTSLSRCCGPCPGWRSRWWSRQTSAAAARASMESRTRSLEDASVRTRSPPSSGVTQTCWPRPIRAA